MHKEIVLKRCGCNPAIAKIQDTFRKDLHQYRNDPQTYVQILTTLVRKVLENPIKKILYWTEYIIHK